MKRIYQGAFLILLILVSSLVSLWPNKAFAEICDNTPDPQIEITVNPFGTFGGSTSLQPVSEGTQLMFHINFIAEEVGSWNASWPGGTTGGSADSFGATTEPLTVGTQYIEVEMTEECEIPDPEEIVGPVELPKTVSLTIAIPVEAVGGPAEGTITVNSNEPTTWTISGPENFGGNGTNANYTADVGNYSISANDLNCRSKSIAPSTNQFLNDGSSIGFTITYTNTCGGQPEPEPVAEILADETGGSITRVSGTNVTIRWDSDHADSCSIAPTGWTGTAGSQQTGPLVSTVTYTLTCTGPGGSDSDSVTVNIIAAPPATHVLSVLKAGTGTGIVSSNPGGINCGATCSNSFSDGSVLTLTASPTGGHSFAGWSGACVGVGACVVTMNQARSVTATFNNPVTYVISGFVYQDLNNTGCNPICTGTKDIGEPGIAGRDVTLETAAGVFLARVTTNASGYYEIGTVGAGNYRLSHPVPGGFVRTTDDSFSFSLTGNYTHDFGLYSPAAVFDYALSQPIPGNLNIVKGVAPVVGTKTIHKLLVSGTGEGVTVVATGAPQGVTYSYTNNPCVTSCNSDVTFTVHPTTANGTYLITVTGTSASGLVRTTNFNLVISGGTYTLSVFKAGAGTGYVSSVPAGIDCGAPATCSHNFNSGTSVTLTATPIGASVFTGWLNDCTAFGTGNCVLSMTAARSATAVFSAGTPFNYSLGNNGNVSAVKGGSPVFVQSTINKTLLAGATQAVSLNVSGAPANVSHTIGNGNCSPNCSSIITFTVQPNAQNGTHLITVTGSPLNKTTTFNLVISGNPMSVSCSAAPVIPVLGQAVTWTSTVNGGTAPFTYLWSGTAVGVPAPTSTSFVRSYSTIGQKLGILTVTDANGQQASCPGSTVWVDFDPEFEEF